MSEETQWLRKIVKAYTESVQAFRTIDHTFDLEEPQETIDAKMAMFDLDIGLVAPHFHGRAILTYTPEAAGTASISGLYETLERIDAIRRAAEVVVIVREQGFVAARPSVEELAHELRQWAESSLATPEVLGALAAYRANPLPLNQQR